MKFVHRLIWGCLCALPLATSAQWQWIDHRGYRVFSDQPPPRDIPEKNILRRSSSALPPTPYAAPSPDTPVATSERAERTATQASADTRQSPDANKTSEEKARKTEEAENAKRAAEAAKIAKTKAENCERARQGKATLDSGMRIARLNAQGEREILDDAARAQEQRHLDAVIASECN